LFNFLNNVRMIMHSNVVSSTSMNVVFHMIDFVI